jgi:hypothetical protein
MGESGLVVVPHRATCRQPRRRPSPSLPNWWNRFNALGERASPRSPSLWAALSAPSLAAILGDSYTTLQPSDWNHGRLPRVCMGKAALPWRSDFSERSGVSPGYVGNKGYGRWQVLLAVIRKQTATELLDAGEQWHC